MAGPKGGFYYRINHAANGSAVAMCVGVIELDDVTLDQVVYDSREPVLVDFWAPWCRTCRIMSTIVEELASKYQRVAKICRINVEQARDAALEFGVSKIPTLVLFKDGRVCQRWVGLTSKKDLIAAIEKVL